MLPYDHRLNVTHLPLADLFPDELFLGAPIQRHQKMRDAGQHDPLADTLDPDARKRFLRADAAYYARTKRHIDINEGTSGEGNARRSCRWQMQLWVSRNVLNLPGFAKANLPGCSDHNYGLAADLRHVDDELKAALKAEGWTDEIQGEEWHFTCVESESFGIARAKIASLRAGLAEFWRRDFVRSFDLNKEANSSRKQLDARARTFADDVEAFNREAKRYNTAREIFQRETDPHAGQRDHLLGLAAQVEHATEQVERSYAAFASAVDALIEEHAKTVEELIALRDLPPERVDASMIAAARRVSPVALARYRTAHDDWRSALDAARALVARTTQLAEDLSRQTGPFAPRAVELLQAHEALRLRRVELEDERAAIERGYVLAGLKGREAMMLMGRAGGLLEQIQAEVDSVST